MDLRPNQCCVGRGVRRGAGARVRSERALGAESATGVRTSRLNRSGPRPAKSASRRAAMPCDMPRRPFRLSHAASRLPEPSGSDASLRPRPVSRAHDKRGWKAREDHSPHVLQAKPHGRSMNSKTPRCTGAQIEKCRRSARRKGPAAWQKYKTTLEPKRYNYADKGMDPLVDFQKPMRTCVQARIYRPLDLEGGTNRPMNIPYFQTL